MATKVMELAQAIARPYWREHDARVVIEAWHRSGLPLATFAEKYQVHRKRLTRWAERLGPMASEPVDFHPVQLVRARERRVPSGDRIEVVLGDGCAVRVPRGFASEDLRQVLDVLEGRW